MTKSLAFEARPRSWSIVTDQNRDGGLPAGLQIGSKRILLNDIESMALETVTERDFKGLTVIGALFGSGAVLFVLLITVFDWRTRFLIGSTFLGALALASFAEAWRANRITLHRLHIRIKSGQIVVFASADATEIADLTSALQPWLRLDDGTNRRVPPDRAAA